MEAAVSNQAEHRRLCDVAERWLRNAMGCKIVLGGVASCREVPDAIGWSNSYKGGYGSIVVECKRSMSDFYRDRKKKIRTRLDYGEFGQLDDVHPATKTSPPHAAAIARGVVTVQEEVKRMGDRRYFLCPWEVISVEAVAKHFPDHGLLWLRGRSIYIQREAPARNDACHASEVVLLKFALIHVRDNLLAEGLSVNLRELTKHPVIADRSGLLDDFERKPLSVKRVNAAVPEPDYKALADMAARVVLQHINGEHYEMSLAGLYAELTQHL